VHWEPESALGGPLYDKKGRSKERPKDNQPAGTKKKRELVPLV